MFNVYDIYRDIYLTMNKAKYFFTELINDADDLDKLKVLINVNYRYVYIVLKPNKHIC